MLSRVARRVSLMLAVLALVLFVGVPSLVTRAADPTDAAGVFTAMTAVLDAFPILNTLIVAVAIAAIALFIVARARRSAKV